MKKVFLLILLFLVTFISYGLVVNVDATTTTIPTKFKGNSYNGNVQFTRDYLSEQTNTISFDSLVYETAYYNYVSTGITVSSDEPMITVLTHGYGGAAFHWSNNYEYISESDIKNKSYSTDFIYDSDSLIESLRIASNADVYFADMQSESSFYLYKIDYSKTVIDSSGNDTNLSMREYEKTLRQKDKDNVTISSDEWEALIYTKYSDYVESISNISNHMIIVFEAYSSQETNDYIYNQLDYMIDKIVYDVRCLNNGVLPKINLISHSRGGITNMQYALEHPALVDSIITLGSPFLGSHLGQSDEILDFVDFSPSSPGIIDIKDATLYEGYMNCWNTYYNELYKDINFHALAGYSSLDFLNYMLINEQHLSEYDIECLKYFFTVVNCIRPLELFSLTVFDILGATDFDEEGFNYACDLLLDEITFDSFGDFLISRYSVEDDLFIHLDSQLAKGYYGVQEYAKDFKMNNCNLDKRSEAKVAIVHNLEARDEEFINYIIDNINYGGGTTNLYQVDEKQDGTLILNGIFNCEIDNGVFIIPSEINGKTVTEIADNAFSSQKLGNVHTIVIPNTITIIGDNAFKKCSFQNIQFENNSNLIYIGDSAFEECRNLNSIIIPNSVSMIGTSAFKMCTGLTTITLSASLSSFNNSILQGCDDLVNISISVDNQHLTIVDNVIYSKNMQRLIYYPSGKTNETFNVPYEVNEILSGAIANNEHLVNLNLYNVTTLRESSIENCDNISNVIGNYVTSVYKNVLLDTCWLENQGDYAKLGTCLVSYKGNETIIDADDLVNFSTIGGDAFSNTNITSITIPNNVELILSSSFDFTNDLEEIILLGETEIFVDSFDYSNKNISFKVLNAKLNDYKTSSGISKYADNIEAISTNVTLVDNGSISTTFNYGDAYTLPISDSSVITKRWYDENGNYYPVTGTWNSLENNLVLTVTNDEHVVWTNESGNVLLNYNLLPEDTYLFDGENIYVNGQLVCQLDNPSKYYEYKYYIGSTEVTNGTYNDTFFEVLVKEEPIIYSITIYNHEPNLPNPTIVQVTCEDIVSLGVGCLSPSDQAGYIFEGLYTDSSYVNKLTDPFDVLDMTEKVLFVQWELEKYTVTFKYLDNNSIEQIMEVIVIDNLIILPTPDSSIILDHYYYSGWKLQNDTIIYPVGDQYEVVSDDLIFELQWLPEEYDIIYKNTEGVNITLPKKYTYKTGATLPTATSMSLANHTFLGWYSDYNLTNRVYSISKSEFGDKVFYAKWRKEVTSVIRTETVTISHGSRWEQHYDVISISSFFGYTAQQLYEKGYRTISLTININMWEKEDGYQEIYLYTGPSDSYKCLYSNTTIEHGGSGKDTSAENFLVSLTVNLSYLSNNAIYIFYSANGAFGDDWCNNNISVNMITVQQTTPEHDYEYISLGSTGHKTTCSCGISKTESHAIRLSEIVNNRANCICCGYLLNLNTDIGVVIQNNTHLVSENGSYILANGTIVLVDEDVEAYEAGTLVFFDKNNENDVGLS